MKFAEEFIDIPVIKHAGKSLLFNKNKTWIVRRGNGYFYRSRSMRTCWYFLLHELSRKYERKNLVSHYDDGLAIFKNVSRPASEKIKKYFRQLFKERDLELTLQFIAIEKS